MAKVINYYAKTGVAELKVEAVSLHVGDRILFIGPATGVLEETVREIRLLPETTTPDQSAATVVNVQTAPQGAVCTIPVKEKVRRGDKLYRTEVV